MIKGKTNSGFKFEVDERVKNDWRLMKAIQLTDSGNTADSLSGCVQLVTLLLGSKGEQELIEHIMKANDGYCPSDAMTTEVLEIIGSLNGKN